MQSGHEIVDHVLHAVQECRTGTGTTLVGIDGPGGAGKSVLAASIARKDARVSVVPIDDFYVPRGKRMRGRDAVLVPWKNVEVSRLRQEVLQPLTAGKEGSYRRYDWGSDALAERRGIPAGGLVLVEGVYALMRPLTDYYHFKVWMDCPRELRLERGLARDGQEALGQWKDQWMPAEDRYASTQRPMDLADLVLDWECTESGEPTLVLKSKAEEMKRKSRGVSRDMSPRAISRRFDILVDLDRMARALGAARPRPDLRPNSSTTNDEESGRDHRPEER